MEIKITAHDFHSKQQSEQFQSKFKVIKPQIKSKLDITRARTAAKYRNDGCYLNLALNVT